ncbi:MAG: VCBS repeat-containing protein, partial [Candidatus Hydrogenedentes bacterium]|nr:VCBS repeat-containing protein [Candidatus Hydrogenedentota bacterium]
DLTGDFNGDRRHDLLVQDRIDRLAIYLSGSSGFGTVADATIAVEPNARFAACDVDGDGRSDVVVFPTPGADRESTGRVGEKKRMAQVWFSRETTP